MQKFKQEELIQYLYGESSADLTFEINEALKIDWELQEEINVLQRTFKQLSNLKLASPRKSSVNAVLRYAKISEPVIDL
ncbi:MAG TPA: hypothetical protein PLY81_08295 [Chitinophagaceae bacterium]|nr:hypothetical protein [Chitinophagaceae bacterium]MCC6635816.1 hypothetical protein [Chitinophagaceae bacterium]HNF30262.1 hypothetical protein [Chitinophagaceae bacterium]HNM33887.1 hypothetical protein [Chitinophagaceae bacterium]